MRAIFIHGFGMNLGPYREFLDELGRKSLAPIAIELPGHGAGASLPSLSRQDIRRVVEASMAEVDAGEEVVLIGESLGCAYLHRMADSANNLLVRGQILISPPLLLRPQVVVKWLLSSLMRGDVSVRGEVKVGETRRALLGRDMARELERKNFLLESVDLSYFRNAALAAAGIFGNTMKSEVPALLVVGGADPLISPAGAHLLRKVSKSITIAQLPESGHGLLWGDEKKFVADAVVNWIKEIRG